MRKRQNKKPKVPSKRAVEKRWTAKLIKGGWTPVADDFIKYYADLPQPITSMQAMLIIHLMLFKWDENPPFPKYRTIADRMGISDIQVRTHARKLEQHGYLLRVKRVGTTNLFDLTPLFRTLERHIQIIEQDSQNKKSESRASSGRISVR